MTAASSAILHPTATGTRRVFSSLDGIRGVAALMVVLQHTSAMWGITQPPNTYLAVDIFFLMSGVVIANAYEGRLLTTMTAREFAWIRIVRMYPLYLIGTLISIAAMLVGLNRVWPGPDLAILSVLGVLFTPNPLIGTPAHMYPLNFPAWSLWLEYVVNVAYGASARKLTSERLSAIVLLSGCGLLFCLLRLRGHDLNIGFTLKSIPAGFARVCFSFPLGILLYRHYRSRGAPTVYGRDANRASAAIMIALALLLLARPPLAWEPVYSFFSVVVVIPALIYAAMQFEADGQQRRLYTFLGAVSFAIYAIHDPLLHALEGALPPAQVQGFTPWLGIAFASALIPLCWLIHSRLDEPLRRAVLAWGRASNEHRPTVATAPPTK